METTLSTDGMISLDDSGRSFHLPVNPKGTLVGYARVSTDMQAQEGISMPVQDKQIRDYAQTKGREIKTICYDFARSGKDDNRPGLTFARQILAKGDVFLVTNLSRLSRNTKDAITIKEELQDRRVSLVILDLNIDTTDAIGSAMFEIYSTMVSLERKQIGNKVSSAMKTHAASGNMNPRPPYGYRWVAKKQALEPVEEEQEVIRFIRELKEKDPEMSCRAVARALNEHPEFPRRGLKEWSVVPVQNIMERHGIPYDRRVERKREGTTWRPKAENAGSSVDL
jgi:site-specific DNA recombinase